MYVYVLSDYEEDGAKNATATLDRSILMGMIDTNWANRSEEYRVEARKGLAELLESSDEDLAGVVYGHDCIPGRWSSAQLHVIRLVEKS